MKPETNNWETIIGLEVHAQLSTVSKIFCGCSTRFGDEPNSNTCPVCLGLPGSLPVLNWRAVELGARAALALGLRVNEVSIFARKNYFYPDLPKGYQISQYDRPFSSDGHLEIVTAERDEGGHAREWRPFEVRITRLHLEEDAGKNVHEGLPRTDLYSYIDLNRAGTPLAEIVTEPDFRTSWEAYDYVNHVRRALQWVGASEADMEKGNLRCEANVSVRREGSSEFGTKVELKNLNSVRFMQRAIEFEIERQIALIESGGRVEQETRLWDEREACTGAMEPRSTSGNHGKYVLVEMFRTRNGGQAVIEEQGLAQVSDAAEIEKIVTDVIASNPQQLEQYRAGKEALFGFFVGQVLKASKGKANPKVVNELLKEKLKAE